MYNLVFEFVKRTTDYRNPEKINSNTYLKISYNHIVSNALEHSNILKKPADGARDVLKTTSYSSSDESLSECIYDDPSKVVCNVVNDCGSMFKCRL